MQTDSIEASKHPFELAGRVAVITGAASGIGLELARACARAEMKLVLADIDERALTEVAHELSESTACVHKRVDVRSADAVNALASLAFDTFGAAHVVFNNAGVLVARPLLETTLDDWRWVLDVNLMGVVNGIAAFVPRMLRQSAESRVVNTASVAGFLSVPDLAAYCASKQAVVSVSEVLHHELRAKEAPVGVTIVCPAFVPTQIAHSARVRPAGEQNSSTSPAVQAAEARLEKAVQSGRLTAADIARMTLEGVRARALYVFTHKKIRGAIEERFAAVYAALAD